MMLNKENIENIYTLTPMQEGMFYHWLKDKSSAYLNQFSYRLKTISSLVPYHFNQAVLLCSKDGFEEEALKAILLKIAGHHDAPLVKYVLFYRDDGDRILIACHHLVIDGISWRILLEDIDNLVILIIRNCPLKNWIRYSINRLCVE